MNTYELLEILFNFIMGIILIALLIGVPLLVIIPTVKKAKTVIMTVEDIDKEAVQKLNQINLSSKDKNKLSSVLFSSEYTAQEKNDIVKTILNNHANEIEENNNQYTGSLNENDSNYMILNGKKVKIKQ